MKIKQIIEKVLSEDASTETLRSAIKVFDALEVDLDYAVVKARKDLDSLASKDPEAKQVITDIKNDLYTLFNNFYRSTDKVKHKAEQDIKKGLLK